MVYGFGRTGARATGLIQPPGKNFFALPPQISLSTRRSSR